MAGCEGEVDAIERFKSIELVLDGSREGVTVVEDIYEGIFREKRMKFKYFCLDLF